MNQAVRKQDASNAELSKVGRSTSLNQKRIKLCNVLFKEKMDSIVYLEDPQTKAKLGFFFAEVTPSMAEQFLLNNHIDQRTMRNYLVNSYLETMNANLWCAANGETIKISDKDKMIDGQHRMKSVVKSGKPQSMLFILGIPDKYIKTIDSGLSRTLSDALKIEGKTKYRLNTHSVAAFIRHFHTRRTMCIMDIGHNAVKSNYRLSNTQAMELFDKLPNLQVKAQRFTELYSLKLNKRLPQSLAILLFYLFDDVNSNATFTIMKTLENGLPFDDQRGKHSPSWRICQWITEQKMIQRRLESQDYINAFIWAFEQTIKDKESFKDYSPKKKSFVIGKNHTGSKQIKELFERIKY